MRHALLLATLTVGLIAGHAPVDGSVRAEGTLTYRVSITNVTNAQSFTPVLAATHRSNVNMFKELVDMSIVERSFQANLSALRTYRNMLQATVQNIGR